MKRYWFFPIRQMTRIDCETYQNTSIFGLNIFILAQLWNNFLQLIFITSECASWNQPVLVSYEETWSWPEKGSNPWSLDWEADTLTTRPPLTLTNITLPFVNFKNYSIIYSFIPFNIVYKCILRKTDWWTR
jgi:hypothetical protein